MDILSTVMPGGGEWQEERFTHRNTDTHALLMAEEKEGAVLHYTRDIVSLKSVCLLLTSLTWTRKVMGFRIKSSG